MIIWILPFDGEPDLSPEPDGVGMREKSPRLLNGDGDEKALLG
jgi:hypothetical protein